MFLVILLYGLFASSFALIKYTIGATTPLIFTGLRAISAGLILLIITILKAKLTGRRLKLFSKPEWRYFIAYTVCTTLISNSASTWVVTQMPSIKAAVYYILTPFITALIMYLLYREKLHRYEWIGILLGAAGTIPIMLMQKQATSFRYLLTTISITDFVMLISIVFYSLGWILVQPLFQTAKFDAIKINGLSNLLSGILVLSGGLLSEGYTIPALTNLHFWSWFSLHTIITTVICYTLYLYLLKKHTPTFLSLASLMEPLFAAFYGWLLLGETVGNAFWIALVLVTVGLYFFNQRKI